MHDSIDPRRLTRSPRTLLLAGILVGGLLQAGCGGSSSGPTVATAGRASTTTPGSTAPAAAASGPLAFAKCMRANGVPTFPDPIPGGGFELGAGSATNPASPAFRAAQAKCQRFMQVPGGSGESSFSAQDEAHALAQLRSVAQCMRGHGISDFPDPRATRPPNLNPGEFSVITDYEGVFLLFPATIDMQSPAWEHAAAACGPLAESFNHPHH